MGTEECRMNVCTALMNLPAPYNNYKRARLRYLRTDITAVTRYTELKLG